MPFKAESTTYLFSVLVQNMLNACDSGSCGGNACRIETVLCAALNDTMALQYFRMNDFSKSFEHLLGLTCAIQCHGVEEWITRGDPYFGEQCFKHLGDAWKKMLGKPAAELEAGGVSKVLRDYAITVCGGLQRYLKSFGGADWRGTGANVYKFNYVVKKRGAASAGGAGGGGGAKKKTKKK